ncbi:MAG: shikimate dehydrogenase [Actinomycetota bacterium]
MGRKVSGSTRLAGVIGWPIAHSLSPVLHNAAFEAASFDAISLGLKVHQDGLGEAVRGLCAMGAVGVSVTMPHKASVVALADHVDPLVKRLGAANCLTMHRGEVFATSTDGQGCLDALDEAVGFAPKGSNAVVLGAGGAAAAIVVALLDAGCGVKILARRPEAAAELARRLGGGSSVAVREDLHAADLIVNATPLGMDGTTGEGALAVVDPSCLSRGQVVLDTVYVPAETPLLVAARLAGAHSVGGLGMLVHQARRQLEGWMGEPVDPDVLWNAVGGRSVQ